MENEKLAKTLDRIAANTQAAVSDHYEMGLTERLDQMESMAQEAMFRARDSAYTQQKLRDLFADTRRIVSDVERLREADISFSDALMILMLCELRKK